jgi:hypothetical protein
MVYSIYIIKFLPMSYVGPVSLNERIKHSVVHNYNTLITDLQRVGCGDMYWNVLAHVKNRWWALVNVVMNLQVS